MLERDFGEIRGDAGDHLTPVARGFQHVGLVHGDELFLAALGKVEGDAGDTLDLILGVAHGVVGLMAGFVDGARLAEVEAAEQFAHDHQIGAGETLRAQRRALRDGWKGNGGTQIGKASEGVAQIEQTSLRTRARR